LSAPQIISGPITGPAVIATTVPTQWVAGTWWSPEVIQGFDLLSFAGGSLPGDYVYRITFDLTGYNPNTAALQGFWTTDNQGSIVLNGVTMGTVGPTAYGTNQAFNFFSGFVAGINTLDFLVNNEFPVGVPWDGPNGENPTGFHYELLGVNGLSAVAAVPEPATLTLLGLGLIGAGTLVRARRKN
jgi:hypothetical protein